MVGACWEGSLPDGETLHRHCYKAQYGKFIRGTAELSGEQGGVRQVLFSGDSMFAWNATDQRIDYTIWGSDGSYGAHQAHYEGDALAFPMRSRKVPDTVAFRSLWRRVDPDHLEVQRQVPDGDGWRTELTVLYRRVP